MSNLAIKSAEQDVPAETSRKHRSVDALVIVAQTALAAQTSGDSKNPHVVNLVVTAETLAEDADGECSVEGNDVCPETARRLSCDAPVVVSLIDGEGVTLKMGRKSRLFTGGSRAAVLRRDKGCCIYPGCTTRKWVDVHHIRHWSKGGPTDPENGATLCGFHHRLVHEGGFSLDHSFTFHTPEGIEVPKHPEPACASDRSCEMPRVKKNACVSTRNGEQFSMDYVISNLLNLTGT